jgi:hypothetical protein
MYLLRHKIPFYILLILTLLISAASSPNPQARWFIETIDAPMLFEDLTPSMIKIVYGNPAMAFGGDHLYYAYWDLDTSSLEVTSVDDSPGVGAYASLASDSHGQIFISYYDTINTSLKFATPSTDIFNPGWVIQTVDATAYSGRGNAIAATVGGQPHISYFTGSTLKHTWRTCTGSFHNIVCTWNPPESIDTGAGVPTSISIEETSGIAHISYSTETKQLKHAYKIGGGSGNCGPGNNWQCEIVPGLTGVLYSGLSSMALWGDQPRIAYMDSDAGLNFAYKDGTGWHISLVHGGTNYGYQPSLALDADGIPHISYHDTSGTVYQASGSKPSGDTWTMEIIPDTSNAGQTAIAYSTTSSAYPCVLYYENTTGIMKYTCKNTTWDNPQVVADSGNVGHDSSLALDPDGVPHIAYYDDLSIPVSPIQATWATTDEGCLNPSTSVPWKCEQLDDNTTGRGTGWLPSTAVNPTNGYPAVSYMAFTETTSGLGYSWYVGSGGDCPGNNAWSCTTIESIAGYASFIPSLAFNTNGAPVIAYVTSTMVLKVAMYVGSGTGDCPGDTNWACQVIDRDLGILLGKPSLALNSDGDPVISYNDNADDQLKLATLVFFGGTGCTESTYPGYWNCSVIDTALDYDYIDSSLVLESDTQAAISYSPGIVKFATVPLPSGTASYETVDGIYRGRFNSLAIYKGTPWIAYTDTNEQHSLRLAHKVGTGNGNCGDGDAWYCEVLDADGSVGLYPALKINSSGMVYISYFDDANGDLKLTYTRLFSFMPLLQKPWLNSQTK